MLESYYENIAFCTMKTRRPNKFVPNVLNI